MELFRPTPVHEVVRIWSKSFMGETENSNPENVSPIIIHKFILMELHTLTHCNCAVQNYSLCT